MAGEERTGEVDVLAEGVRLRFRRREPVPVAELWAALTEPDRLARWIGTYDGVREPGGAGTFTMTHEDEPVGEPMRVVACAAPVRLVVEWDTEGGWRVELELGQDGPDAVLTFTQLFPAGTDVTDYALGWCWYLDKLHVEVAGGPPVGTWAEFLAEVATGHGRG